MINRRFLRMVKKNLFRPVGLVFLYLFCVLLPVNAIYAQNLFDVFLRNELTRSSLNNQPSVNQPTSVARTVEYHGYSQDFLSIKNLILEKHWQQAYDQQLLKISGINTPDFLNSNETGLIALDMGQAERAIEHFASAEFYLKQNMERSILENSVFDFGGELFSMATGVGEVTEYNGIPFERILMLNYKSIAYLLNGERKAYNVTRRAIDWQNIEQKEFEKSLEEAKEQIKEEESKIKDKVTEQNESAQSAEQTTSTQDGIQSGNVFKVIADQYSSSKKTALSVPSAYVNPFGFYMAGIVQELDAYEDASLRDNARISYQKALKLNPKSQVIKQALKDIKKRPPRNKKLVHVIAADGFAPEKKTLQFGLDMPGGVVPVKLPLYESVPSKVAYIRVKSGKTTLTTLSTVADIEAIALRHQLDSLPFEHFKVLAAITRSTAENVIWQQLGVFGAMAKQFRESFANPDMRSWMSLPKRLMAGRFYVSKNLSQLTVVSYDSKWRRLATEQIKIPKNSHGVIYIRSIDSLLSTTVNKPLWVKI
jgi:hypothetical protein